MPVALQLREQLLERIRREYLAEHLFAVRQAAEHVRHVERQLVDGDLSFLELGGVAELERCFARKKDLVALAIDDVDLFAEIEEKQPFRVAEDDLHIAGEIDVFAMADDAVEGRRLGREILR